MNRRQTLLAAIAAAAPFPAFAKSKDDVKRALLYELLSLPDLDGFELELLRVMLQPGHHMEPFTRKLLDSGIPMREVFRLNQHELDRRLQWTGGRA